ncbi:MAG: IclR family transcriptional regulator [Aquamicrobium sp.]|uniref:IclR family transcriptional regulator n=1 Tax=Aquamicrobium sp. TaxID=1872579 RepID=UPI00349E6AAF|nr:IclR family transcriptional regulator [Aquamicrobium sp.]
MPSDPDNPQKRVSGASSIDAALHLLLAMSAYREPVALSELARGCGMQPSKAHRYLAAFMAAGLVEQTGRSGRYFLGKMAMQIGLAAIARHDFVNAAADSLAELCADTGLTALLSVWGNNGATVVRWERAASPTVTSMGLGTTLPLLTSATGRAFLAWAPPNTVLALRESEVRRIKRNPQLRMDFDVSAQGIAAMIEGIRKDGFASVDGRFIPGLVAAAAPILDWQGEAQAVVTLVGTDPCLTNPGSGKLEALMAYCRERSIVAQGEGSSGQR